MLGIRSLESRKNFGCIITLGQLILLTILYLKAIFCSKAIDHVWVTHHQSMYYRNMDTKCNVHLGCGGSLENNWLVAHLHISASPSLTHTFCKFMSRESFRSSIYLHQRELAFKLDHPFTTAHHAACLCIFQTPRNRNFPDSAHGTLYHKRTQQYMRVCGLSVSERAGFV